MKSIIQVVIGYILLIILFLILFSKILVFLHLNSNFLLISLLLITLIFIRIKPKKDDKWYRFKIIIMKFKRG